MSPVPGILRITEISQKVYLSISGTGDIDYFKIWLYRNEYFPVRTTLTILRFGCTETNISRYEGHWLFWCFFVPEIRTDGQINFSSFFKNPVPEIWCENNQCPPYQEFYELRKYLKKFICPFPVRGTLIILRFGCTETNISRYGRHWLF